MTCKDCVHFIVCKSHNRLRFRPETNGSLIYNYEQYAERLCKYFFNNTISQGGKGLKDKYIKVRLSAAELEKAKKMAKEQERTVSSFIRWLITKEAKEYLRDMEV